MTQIKRRHKNSGQKNVWKGDRVQAKHYLPELRYCVGEAQGNAYLVTEGDQSWLRVDVKWPDGTYGGIIWVEEKKHSRPHWEVADGEGPTLWVGKIPKTDAEARKIIKGNFKLNNKIKR